MPEFVIRPAIGEDIRQIKRVAKRAFRGKPDAYWAYVGAKWAEMVFVAELSGRVIGVAEIEIVRLSAGPQGHIGYIFVDPDYRRRGVATALLKASEKWFVERGAVASWALTDPDNIPTRNLFRKLGYVELGFRDAMKLLGFRDAMKLLRRMVYWEGDVILRKELSGAERGR